jgi:hypothetical protein
MVDEIGSKLNWMKSKVNSPKAKDKRPIIMSEEMIEDNIENDLIDNQMYRLLKANPKSILIKQDKSELKAHAGELNDKEFNLSKDSLTRYMNSVGEPSVVIEEDDTDQNIDSGFIEYLKRNKHSIRMYKKRSGSNKK